MNLESLAIILKVSWRNAWRNKRRTILTMLTIVVGVVLIVFSNALMKGMAGQLIADATGPNIGDIQIHEKGFWDNRAIDYAFEPSRELYHLLSSHRHITAYTERVIAAGLLAFKDSSQGVSVQGIDPEKEQRVFDLHKRIRPGGRFLGRNDKLQVVLGTTLAEKIGAGVGDRIALISQGFDGSIAADRFTIVGLFESGNPEYDRSLVLMPLSQAKETFTMMGFVHAIALRLDELSNLTETKKDIQGIALAMRNQPGLEVMGWHELMPELMQYVVMSEMATYVFVFVLYMLVAFGILNTIHMSVFERTREFGVMLSIGTRPHQITAMVLAESVYISLLGILFGIGLGSACSFYFQIHPIDLGGYVDEIAVFNWYTTSYPAEITWLNILMTSLLIFLTAILFSLSPARRAGQLDCIKAIRKL